MYILIKNSKYNSIDIINIKGIFYLYLIKYFIITILLF